MRLGLKCRAKRWLGIEVHRKEKARIGRLERNPKVIKRSLDMTLMLKRKVALISKNRRG